MLDWPDPVWLALLKFALEPLDGLVESDCWLLEPVAEVLLPIDALFPVEDELVESDEPDCMLLDGDEPNELLGELFEEPLNELLDELFDESFDEVLLEALAPWRADELLDGRLWLAAESLLPLRLAWAREPPRRLLALFDVEALSAVDEESLLADDRLFADEPLSVEEPLLIEEPLLAEEFLPAEPSWLEVPVAVVLPALLDGLLDWPLDRLPDWPPEAVDSLADELDCRPLCELPCDELPCELPWEPLALLLALLGELLEPLAAPLDGWPGAVWAMANNIAHPTTPLVAAALKKLRLDISDRLLNKSRKGEKHLEPCGMAGAVGMSVFARPGKSRAGCPTTVLAGRMALCRWDWKVLREGLLGRPIGKNTEPPFSRLTTTAGCRWHDAYAV